MTAKKASKKKLELVIGWGHEKRAEVSIEGEQPGGAEFFSFVVSFCSAEKCIE